MPAWLAPPPHVPQYFLSVEQQDPGNVAYDRPSPKLLAFLQRHYGLKEYIPQVQHVAGSTHTYCATLV